MGDQFGGDPRAPSAEALAGEREGWRQYREDLERRDRERVAAQLRAADEMAQALMKATIRLDILLGRMRGCVEHEVNDSHALSIEEGAAWIEEQRNVAAAYQRAKEGV